MFTLETYLTGHELRMRELPGLASGSVRLDRVHFIFDSAWDGLTKVALFWGADSDTPFGVAVDAEGYAIVPWEVLEEKSIIRFGVYGTGTDTRLTSTLIRYKVQQGAWSEEIGNSGDPTPTMIEQFEVAAQAAIDAAQAVADAAVTNFAPEFVATKAYTAGEYVTHDGILYRFTVDHSAGAWSGTDAVKAPVGAELGDLKSALGATIENLQSFAGMDAANYFTRNNTVKTDIAFTFNADGSCTVTGTAGSTRFYDYYASVDEIPIWLERGKEYSLTYSGTNVRFRIFIYENGTFNQNPLIDTLTDCTFIVPATATGLILRLSVSGGKTANETVNPIINVGESTNAIKLELSELASYAMLACGVYTGDVDDIDVNGWYVCTDAASHLPGTDTIYLVGTMFSNANHRTGSQIAYSLITGKAYTRRKVSNAWKSWVSYEQDLSPYCPYNGTLPNNTDFNDLDTRGTYITSSAYTYTNLPTDDFVGTVTNLPLSTKVTQQYAIMLDTGETYYRIKSGATPTWKAWLRLSPDEPKYVTSGKYVAFGDSVTWGAIWELKDAQGNAKPLYQAGFEYQIPTRIAIACGMENDVVNEGVGGTGYFNRSSVGVSVTEKILAYDFTGVELVTIMAGVNDKPTTPLGTASDSASSETICGAIKRIIDHFAENWPAVQLIFIQPTPSGHLSDVWGGKGSLQWSLNEFDEQVSVLCHNEHVGYVNWWESNICKQWDLFSGGYSYNTTSGNVNGPNYSHMTNESDCAKIGDFIAGKVSTLFHGRN